MSSRLRSCVKALFRPYREPEKLQRPVLKGTMRRAIVVSSPDERFTEAVFIMKDSIFREQGVTASEVVTEAREAAADCTERMCGRRKSAPMSHAAVFLSGAAAAILALWAAGLL